MRLVLWGLFLGIVSTAQSQTAQKAPSKDMSAFLQQIADTRKTIADGYAQWTEAVKAKNVDTVTALYTDDAIVLPEEKDAVSGKIAIRTFYGDWFQQEKLVDEKFENINSMQQGDLLIDSTKYSGTVVKDGKEVPLKGKRLVVWKRDLQGHWKILRDTWNMSPAS